jgi:tetratricopeptide (TPR) repeat protein
MKLLASLLVIAIVLIVPGRAKCEEQPAVERLGQVDFSNSCSASVHASFNRGVALLHDFWYEEARRQFEQIANLDPACAMSHWGIAMSVFHQIWDRPQPKTMTLGWNELEKAQSLAAKTSREREYISALSMFYRPGKDGYESRADAYSAAMAKLSRDYPADIDAAAFYALSLLAAKKPSDSTLDHERAALAILTPLFAKYPDHPGLAHYIIHACDNPELAPEGLHAAQRYGSIAPSAAHSAHMPAHIFARLGMWQPDIDANLASVAAAEKALGDHPSALFDQLHADDFLLYAYLQSGQDAHAKGLVERTEALLTQSKSMNMAGMSMSERIPEYQEEFPAVYDLEMRDWKAAAALTPAPGASPEIQMITYWARAVADGHLRQVESARADLAKYQALNEQVKAGKHAYFADSTAAQVADNEVLAWTAFAEGNSDKALSHIRAAADLQDKVGQGEVDIPAREMLADMLLELQRHQEALTEYDRALKASPNRFNGLFNAGRAAEAIGDKARAAKYYAVLMQSTGNGAQSTRVEFAHVKTFLGSDQVANR